MQARQLAQAKTGHRKCPSRAMKNFPDTLNAFCLCQEARCQPTQASFRARKTGWLDAAVAASPSRGRRYYITISRADVFRSISRRARRRSADTHKAIRAPIIWLSFFDKYKASVAFIKLARAPYDSRQ